jgi:hypothetical protein
MQSEGTKVVLVENFSEESLTQRGLPLSRPEATAQARTLVECLAVVVGSAWSTRAMASRQRDWAEGMFCPLCDFVYVSILLLASEEFCSTICRVRDGF